jgi:hypothetical protein
MPVRRMTEAEAQQIFGSGLIIIGMKRPTESATHEAGAIPNGRVSRDSGVATKRDALQSQGTADSADIHDPNPIPTRQK